MIKINNKEKGKLWKKLKQDLKNKFFQLYEEIKVGKTLQGLWEYIFIDPLMKHFEAEDLKSVIEIVTREVIEERLLTKDWTKIGNTADERLDNILDEKKNFKMTGFLHQAGEKYEIRLIDVKNSKEEILDYKKLTVYFYPYPEKGILELPEEVSYVYEENELQVQLEIPPKGGK